MMYFRDTEISFAFMMRPEIEYWLSQGNNIFEHQKTYWMCLKSYKGHRIMISVPEDELLMVRPHLYTKTGKIFRGVKC